MGKPDLEADRRGLLGKDGSGLKDKGSCGDKGRRAPDRRLYMHAPNLPVALRWLSPLR